MKPRSRSKVRFITFIVISFGGPPFAADAGIMDPAVGQQTYRDFAENRGVFAPGATNVEVHKLDGTVVGTIPVMPDLDSTVDGGWSALAGGASFMATVAHNNATTVSFTDRFGGGSSTPFYDSYSFINYNRMPNGYDFAAPRLNKMVTEVEAPEYFLLSNYSGPETTYPDAAGALYAVRAGGGTQTYATGNGTETTLTGAYAYLTGGTIKFTSNYQSVSSPDGFGYIYWNQPVTAALPLDIGIRAGDSGSPSWLYNPTTARYEYIGAGQSGGGSGFNALDQMRGGNEWAVGNILAYNSTITDSGGGAITWNADSSGTGNFTQGGNEVGTYIGLPDSVRGATSTTAADGTGTAYASDTQLDATRNLVFDGAGGTITLTSPLDTGAGTLSFNSDYNLTGARLNSAGVIVKGGHTLTSQLTGISGDEWRKIGAGTLVIAGAGSNSAKLITGGGGLTELDRSGGHAVSSVRINGDRNTTVRLVGDNQIAGSNGGPSTVTFGHRGGRLDFFGHDASWSGITHMDADAEITNTKDGDASTFTFTGSGAQTYLGRFTDDGSPASGLLDVVYQGGGVWSLAGAVSNAGSWTVAGGEVRTAGTPTLHAGGYVDANDWRRATFSTGPVTVADGAQFTIGHHADVSSNIIANGTSTVEMSGENNTFTGNVLLDSATARFHADTPGNGTALVAGALTGSGYLQKDGPGTLRLTNPGNVLGAGNSINAGCVSASTIGALGSGAGSWTLGASGVISADGATAAAVKAMVSTGATGTLALATTGGNPDDTPDLTGAGYADVFLGALGEVAIGGDPNTTDSLTEWTGGGWKLGGGGGTLTVNLRLAGNGELTIGNGHNTGVVILANSGNAAGFTGTITVNTGVDLRYTDVGALGDGTLDVGYGSSVTTLTSSGSDLLARISDPSEGVIAIEDGANNPSDFDFASAGLDHIYLGAEGGGAYSGNLTPGSNGYRFGGDGSLTVASDLTGSIPVTIDGHDKTGGVITLSGNNTFTGALTIRGYDSSIITSGGSGSVTLAAGSSTAFGSGAPVSLFDGGIMDLDGHDLAIGSLAGNAGSGVTNSSTTDDATLTVSQTVDSVLSSNLSSPGGRSLNLTKTGPAVLTISGSNTHTGAHVVQAGALRLGASAALGAPGSTVAVQAGGSFDMNGFTPATFGGLTLAGSGAGGMAALYNSSASTGVTLPLATLTDDASIDGATGTSYAITTLNPAGHTATIGATKLNFTSGASIGAGHLVANNGAVVYMSGTITGDAGTLTLNSGGTLDVRDFNNPGDLKTIVLNGGRIGNGYTHNGGGAQPTISNPINVVAASTLDGNNGYWNYRLQLAGPLTGTANLTLASSRGIRFMGDTSGYTGAATVTSSSGVAFNGTNDQVFNGVIAGSKVLYKEGAKNLTLNATNTYTGGTELLGGSLTVGTLGGIGTFTSGNAGYLAVKNGAAFVYTGAGSETSTRRLWLDSGAAVFNIANPTGALVWNPNGGTIGGSGGGLVTKTGPGALTLGGPFSGVAAIAVNQGTLTLTATNTHAGGASVTGGTLVLDYSSNNTSKLADSAALTFGGGTLTLTGGSHTETVGSTTLAAGSISTLTRDTGTSVLSLGVITRNAGALLEVDAPYIAKTTTALVNGLLPGVQVDGSLATRDGSDFVVPFTGFSDVTRLSSGSKLIANDAANNVRVIEGTGTPGDITLAATTTDANTLTNSSTGGPATVAFGGNVLRLSAAGQIISEAASQGLVLSGGTLTAGGAPDAAGDVVIVNSSSAATTIGSIIADNGSGTVSLTKLGSGGMTLSGASTYSGETSVLKGSLSLGTNNALPGGSGKGDVLVAADATLDLAGFTETINGLTGAGVVDNSAPAAANLTIGANDATTTFSGVIRNTAGSLSLTKTGAGAITLDGSNSYAGVTTIGGGTLVANGGAALPDTGAVSLANTSGAALLLGASETIGSLSGGGSSGGNIDVQDHILTITQAADGSYGGVLSGTGGSLVKSGAGKLTLSKVNAFTDSLTVSGGTLEATAGTSGNASAIGAGATTVTVAQGATLKLSTSSRTCGFHTGSANILGGTITFNTSDNSFAAGQTLTFDTAAGIIDGTGQWRMRSEGAKVHVTAAASGSAIEVNTLTLTGVIANGYVFEVDDGAASNDLTVSSAIGGYNGGEALVKSGSGAMAITRQAGYTGNTTVNGGTLKLGIANLSGGTLSGTPRITVNTGAVLDLYAQDAVGWTSGKQGLTIDGGTVTQSAGNVRSTLINTVIMTGGTLASSGAGDGYGNYSFFSGAGITATSGASGVPALVSANTISIQTTGDFPVAVTRGPASPASDLTITSVVRDNMSSSVGNLVKSGDGILTLAGANTYRGQTKVNAGTLVLTGSLSSTAATTVESGATLRGNGSIAGPATINGALEPGVSDIGTLTINQAVTLAGTAAMQIHKSGAILTSDRLAGTGSLACGGTLTVTATGDVLAAGDTFTLFDKASYSGSFSNIQLPALAPGLMWDDSQLLTNGTIAVLSPVQSWRKENFGSTANAGNAANDADPDGDGLSNLLEYALGLDPNAASNLDSKVAADTSTGFLRLSVTRNPDATDVTLAAEVSGDLATWGDQENIDVNTEVDTATSFVARDMTETTAADRRFIRLRVTSNE